MSMSISGVGSASIPQIVSGASSYAPPAQKMSNLFQQIDTSGTGSISQSQFQQAFATLNPPANFQAAGANAVFQQLDPTGSGSVSKSDFVSSMMSMMRTLRANAPSNTNAAPPTSTPPVQSISQSLQAFLQLGPQAFSANNGVGNILDTVV
jgi:hypothetical protein